MGAEDSPQNNKSRLAKLVSGTKYVGVAILLLAILHVATTGIISGVIFGISSLVSKTVEPLWNKHIMHYQNPWWTGEEVKEVCETDDQPYCYTALVTSDGKEISKIQFYKGGTLLDPDLDSKKFTPTKTECKRVGKDYREKHNYGFDRMCKVWLDSGLQYEVINEGWRV